MDLMGVLLSKVEGLAHRISSSWVTWARQIILRTYMILMGFKVPMLKGWRIGLHLVG